MFRCRHLNAMKTLQMTTNTNRAVSYWNHIIYNMLQKQALVIIQEDNSRIRINTTKVIENQCAQIKCSVCAKLKQNIWSRQTLCPDQVARFAQIEIAILIQEHEINCTCLCVCTITRMRTLLFVLKFYGPVNPMVSCRARSVYLTTRLLGRISPLSG